MDIKRRLIVVLIITLLFSLSACATKKKYINQQKEWIGKKIQFYVEKFGYPNNIIQISKNSNIETYVYISTAINPGTIQQAGNPINSLIMANKNPQFVQFGALTCTTWVSINKKTKIIKNITFRGNYCVTSN